MPASLLFMSYKRYGSNPVTITPENHQQHIHSIQCIRKQSVMMIRQRKNYATQICRRKHINTTQERTIMTKADDT